MLIGVYDTLLEDREAICNLAYPDIPYHGVLSVNQGKIELRIMPASSSQKDIQDGIAIGDGNVVVSTQHGHTVTLLKVREDLASSSIAGLRSFVADEAIIGNSRWFPTDMVGQIMTIVPQARALFSNSDLEREVKQKIANHEDLDVRDVRRVVLSQDNIVVTLSIPVSVPVGASHRVAFLEPRISVDFDNPTSLTEAIEQVNHVRVFLEMSMGISIDVDVFYVRKSGLREARKPIASEDVPHRYCVYRPAEARHDTGRRSADPLADARIVSKAIFSGIDGRETDAFSNALQTWLGRGMAWTNANVALSRCLTFGKEFSSERLINSCNWLEVIPDFQARRQLDKEMIRQIQRSTFETVKGLGIEKRQKRINDFIGMSANESREAVIMRVIMSILHLLPSGWNGKMLQDRVSEGFKIRADAAHGRIRELFDRDVEESARRVSALEMLSFLLMVRDLKTTDRGSKALNWRLRLGGLPVSI